MKRVLYLLPVLVFLFAFKCDNEPLEGDFGSNDNNLSCIEAATATANASLSFDAATPENYTELCNAYTIALENQIGACGDPDGSLQATLDDLDCSNFNNNENIVGTWQLIGWYGENPIDINNDGIESNNFLSEIDCYENEFLEFSSDLTGQIISNSFAEFDLELVVGTTDTYNYVVDCILEEDTSGFTWEELTPTTYLVTVSGDSFECVIIGNQLRIFFPQSFYAANADLSVEIIEDLTFVYVKL